MRLAIIATSMALLLATLPAAAQPAGSATEAKPTPLDGTGCLLGGVPSRVVEACTAVLRQEPKHAHALALRAVAHFGNQTPSAAREDINAALALEPNNLRALIMRLRLTQVSAAPDAVAALTRDIDLINSITGTTAEHFEARGLAKAARRDHAAALQIYSEGLEAHPNTPALLRQRAASKAAMGHIEPAIVDMTAALTASPADMNGYVVRGGLYLTLRRYSDAYADINRALLMDLARADVRAERGRVYAARKDHDLALADFDRAIIDNPSSGAAYYYRSQVHLDRNDFDKALADLNVAIAVNPRSVAAFTRRANVHRRKGDRAAAFIDYDRAVQIDGNALEARVARSGARAEAGDHDRALADADDAVRIAPNAAMAHSARAYALLQKGENQGAVDSASKAIELGSRSANDYGYRSLAYRRIGRLDLAIQDADKEIELAPEAARGYQNRASLYAALGDTTKAQTDTAKAEVLKAAAPSASSSSQPKAAPAASTAPVSASAQPPAAPAVARPTDLARAQIDRREYDLAITELDKLLVTDTRNYDGYMLRAEAYLGKRDIPRALADATKAVDINGTRFIGLAIRCELNLLSKRFDAAMADCNRAISVGPATAATYASRGAAHTQLRSYAAALEDFDKSLSMRETPYARFNRGIAYFYMKSLDKAADDFRKVLADNPNHQGAVLGLRMLTTAGKSQPMEVRLVRNADPRCGDQCAEWIAADGDIDASTTDKFKAVFRQIGERKLPIFINSQGGRITSSLEVGRLIRARGLDVYVTRTEITDCKGSADVCRSAKGKGVTFGVPRGKLAGCASACTNILAAGTQRSVGASALVGVHQAAYYTTQDGKRTLSDKEIPQETYIKLKDYFVEMGVDAVVMLRMLNTPHKDMYWFRREELAQTRLTTQVKSGEELINGAETDDWMSVSKTAAAEISKATLEPGAGKSESKSETVKSEPRPTAIPLVPPSAAARPNQPPPSTAAPPSNAAQCIGNRITYASFNDCVAKQQHPSYCSRICGSSSSGTAPSAPTRETTRSASAPGGNVCRTFDMCARTATSDNTNARTTAADRIMFQCGQKPAGC
jgi:tetratricopeptide (TPR) repeat protein